jgi:hypothetical protein
MAVFVFLFETFSTLKEVIFSTYFTIIHKYVEI